MSTIIIRGLLLGALLFALGGTAALAQGADPGPDTPVSSDAEQSFPDFEDGATVAEPDPSIVDPTETPWDHIVVTADGRTLWVYYWGGTDTCYGLARVDAVIVDGTLDITLWTGTRPDAVGQACIEIAQLFKTVVVLVEPIITGGAA